MQLHVPHIGVDAFASQQLVVRALFSCDAVLQDDDVVGVPNRP